MIPPSLRNIYKELVDDDTTMTTKPTHGYLEKWAQQGVLMLNSVLTVRRGEANSHAKRGWEEFTDEIIRLLVSDRRDKNKSKKENEKEIGLVFLLWGRPANKKAESVIGKYRVGSKSTVICTSHPSPLGASKTKSPFLGSGCFSKANCALVEMGLDPVDWRVEQ
jgi:uracil-DNA glycosylase